MNITELTFLVVMGIAIIFPMMAAMWPSRVVRRNRCEEIKRGLKR